jgi:Zn-dependent protease
VGGDLTLQTVALRICAGLLIVSVHGSAVAATAGLLGDPGPRQDGRWGLSPLPYIDLIGGLLIVLFTYGWVRPVAIDADRMRPGRIGLLAVVAVSAFATIGVAELLRLVRPVTLNLLPDTAAATFFVLVEIVWRLSVSFTLFNILPLPPLTGQHLLLAAWPKQRDTLRRAQPYCVVLLAVLIATGIVGRLLAPAEAVLQRVILDG